MLLSLANSTWYHPKSSTTRGQFSGNSRRHCTDFVRRHVPGKTTWQNWCTHNFKRMQSEANVYVNLALKVTILVYVDDLVVCANKRAITEIMTTLSKSLLLKHTGDLATDGVVTGFIGRTFTRQGDVVYIKNSDKYLNGILSTYSLTTCKAATTTGMSSHSSNLQQCDDPLDSAEHTQYRSTVGKLMWPIAIRYAVSYTHLTLPTKRIV